MYGKFPKIIKFLNLIFSKSKSKISLLYILIFLIFLYFSLRLSVKILSFSIRISDFGLLFNISLVKAPLPGPISIIFLFLTLINPIIFLIIFLSFKKFCPKDFLAESHFLKLFKKFIHFNKLNSLALFFIIKLFATPWSGDKRWYFNPKVIFKALNP